MKREKEDRFCPAGTVALNIDEKVEDAYQILSGRVQIDWKWSTWESFSLKKPDVFGLIECEEQEKSFIRAQSTEDTFLRPLSADQLQNPDAPELSVSILHSLAVLYGQVIQENYFGLALSESEKMYQAFETYVKKADKQRAIDCYARFVTAFPTSPFVDQMLNYIQDISLGKDLVVEIPENDEDAFLSVLTQANDADPQQNLTLLKKFEEKYPNSIYYERIMDMIIVEYEKLGDEYQLNHYLRKYIFTYPNSQTAPHKLLSLISVQRKSGEPSWYENALRFLLYYPDSELIGTVRKFVGIDQ